MQRMVPFLSLGKKSKEAVEFYTSLGAKSVDVQYFDKDTAEKMNMTTNDVMHGIMEFDGQPFDISASDAAADGSALMDFADTPEESKRMKELFEGFSKDGKIIMPLEAQFWGANYGYVIDKFGIKWQVHQYTHQAK